ncbi:MAG: DUF4097 domain-containing protein [Gammaproteobacteria bacterium]|nr:DUF4097 domain-containing protein [Gammaproteobacteria bacterium]
MSRSTYAIVASLMTSMAMAETVERSFEAAAGGRFVLDADWGHVEVETWDQEIVDVVVEHADKLELEFQRHDDAVTVHAERKGRSIARWFAKEDSPRFHVTVPRRFDLDLVTAGGNIHIPDLDGEANARTSGGKLKIDNVSGRIVGHTSGGSIHVESAGGPVKARTSGGSIRIGSSAGAVDARTSGGSIRIGRAQGPTIARTSGGSIELASIAGSVEARTSGGSIKATVAGQPDGDSSLHTVGGSITFGLAEGVALDIDARTTGGRVTAELANLESTRTDRSTLFAVVNSGGPTMTLRTTGGSIRLLNR